MMPGMHRVRGAMGHPGVTFQGPERPVCGRGWGVGWGEEEGVCGRERAERGWWGGGEQRRRNRGEGQRLRGG